MLATTFLRKQHREVLGRLKAAPKTKDATRARELMEEISQQLRIHTALEEEIFYPAVRAATGSTVLADHSLCDHAYAKDLIAQIDEMAPGDARYDALVVALCAHVVPHMNEEQAGVFQFVRQAGLDTATLGRQMAQRQKTLREDVTLFGLPHVNAGALTWPMACRVVMA